MKKSFSSPVLIIWLIFALLLAVFSAIFRPFFPIQNGRMGHDYSLVLTQWLDGDIWFRNNGLSLPWFSPSFCAGQPFFADPQSAYYSFPQFLAFLNGPINAAYLTMCICAGLMFWGGYLLMRWVFSVEVTVAVLVGGLLMFNGFLPHRLIVGHMTFHGFAFVPWLALLLMVPIRDRTNSLMAAFAAGILLAYWVHSGFGTLILAGGLAVFLVGLIYGLCGGSLTRFFARAGLASVIGIGLSASKLWATYSFLSNYPRTFYVLPGAVSLYDGIALITTNLFLPSEWAAKLGSPRLTNFKWAEEPHEWAYNFGVVLAILLAVLAINNFYRKQWLVSLTLRQCVIGFVLFAGLLWPLAFNLWSPSWNAFLKTIPIINSASTPIRWIIVYIPVIALATGLWLDRTRWKNRRMIVVVSTCLVATMVQVATEPRDYYVQQKYDARPMAIADQMLRSGEFKPEIKTLGISIPIKADKYETLLTGNDTFIAGMSQVFCYNPVFGYRLEKFSAANLRPGSVFTEHGGYLNMKNPACYVFPKENNCRPGDLFRVDQLKELKSFVAYQPYSFGISESQKTAGFVSTISLVLVLLAVVAWLSKTIVQTGLDKLGWKKH